MYSFKPIEQESLLYQGREARSRSLPTYYYRHDVDGTLETLFWFFIIGVAFIIIGFLANAFTVRGRPSSIISSKTGRPENQTSVSMGSVLLEDGDGAKQGKGTEAPSSNFFLPESGIGILPEKQ